MQMRQKNVHGQKSKHPFALCANALQKHFQTINVLGFVGVKNQPYSPKKLEI